VQIDCSLWTRDAQAEKSCRYQGAVDRRPVQCGDGSTISSEAMRDGIPPRPKWGSSGRSCLRFESVI